MSFFVRTRAEASARQALSAEGFFVLEERDRRWTPVGSVEELRAAAAEGRDLWLRGLEVAGPCGEHTAVVLLRAAIASGRPFLVEGLSIRGMAAALAAGASGAVLDAELWLTREAATSEDERALIRTASSGLDTAVDGELRGERVRRLVRGPRSIAAPQNLADARRHDGRPLVEAVRTIAAEVRAQQALLASLPPSQAAEIVQGPMANIAEGTGLALAVRAAGAMPFAALGALDPAQATCVLQGFAREVPPPWGVGVIGFDMMPHRDAHLEAIFSLGERGPAAVILAGGNVALAAELGRRGLRVWLHTPSGRLAEAALEAGVHGIVLEGHEAGGHVGKLTSAALWEEGLAAVERFLERSAGPAPTVVLAGGIGDAASAAFARAMSARARAMGADVRLQAGTAFLLTHEAAERGQVTPIYQARALSTSRTVLVGSSVNLPLRCAPNAFTDEARAQELRWEAEGVPRAERRLKLEHHNLGRTRIAAKGIERDPTGASRYRPVPAPRQDREGAFTIGQGAAVTPRVLSVAEVITELTSGADALLERAGGAASAASRSAFSRWRPVRAVRTALPAVRAPSSSQREGDIAIIGMGCVLPKAHSVERFLRNLLEGVDAVGPIPASRWAEHRYFDAAAGSAGPVKSYSRHAGAVGDFRFDPLPFRIPPRVVATMDPSQRLALAAAAEAVQSARLDKAPLDKRRAGVVIGNAMGGEFAKSAALRVRFREVMDAVVRDEALSGLSVESLQALEARVEEQIAAKLPPVDVDSMAGLLSNVVAGRIAAWLDWMGGNLTVDAACAASLAALSVAVDWLRLGRCDVVLTGGVDTDLAPESYVGFCRTQALSRTGSSPFSARADGFVMGEGAAVLVLKRLPDALRDGDNIQAVIRGVGASSDGRGRGITAPRPEGQSLAIERAYAEAGLEPRDIGLIEAHGTGTALGDQTEVGVLARHFAEAKTPTWLGSVKSMIGHLKSAAGAASLLKAALALRTGVIPPTLHAGPLEPALNLDRTPFRLPRSPVLLPEDRPRASVSAFGFGGTNYHVLLQAPATRAPSPHRVLASPPEVAAWKPADTTPLLIPFGAPSHGALLQAVRADRPCTIAQAAKSEHRAIVLLASGQEQERAALLAKVSAWLERGPAAGSSLGTLAFHGQGPARPVVLGFPGQGAPRRGAIDAVRRLPDGARALAELDEAIGQALGDGLPLRAREDRSDPLSQHAVLYAVGLAWSRVLAGAALPVSAVLGHSLGAYAALAAAGAASALALLPAVLARGRALSETPAGGMVAVLLPPAQALALAERHGLSLAAVNGPERVTLAGTRQAVAAAAAELGPSRARVLDVERAYHSPLVQGAVPAVREALSGLSWSAPSAQVWSARTAGPLQPGELSEDLLASIVEPVRFDPAVRALLAAGQTVWIEAGPGTQVSRIVQDAGGVAVPLDGGELGPALAAAWLLALGHPGLAERTPGSWLVCALPAVAEPEPLPPRTLLSSPPSSQPAPSEPSVELPVMLERSLPVSTEPVPTELAARAEAVLDLRIASLAEPEARALYRQARRALLLDLARQDAAAAAGAPQRLPEPAPAPLEEPLEARTADPVEAAPSPQPAPARQTPVEGDALREGVLAAICEVTGYPAELITEGADLEGELGIDSIRKMEILGLLEQRFGFTTAESDYAGLAEANLAALVEHVRVRTQQPKEAPPARSAAAEQCALLAVPLARRLPERAEGGSLEADAVLDIPAGQDPEQVVVALASKALPDPLKAVVRQDPGGQAAAAFLRSAARELGRSLLLVHLDPALPSEAAQSELSSDKPGEVWLGPERARTARVPLAISCAPGDGLPPRPALLVTGGVRGIVLPCLMALQDLQPRVLLMGRTPRERAEPMLEPLRAAGIELHYAVADVTQAIDVKAAAADARRRFGRIDAVVHAAGVLRDGPLGSVPEEELRQVVRTKWTGAQNLVEATAQDELSVFCTFSSLVAWVGNAAQTTYAAANAAMETLRHPAARRSLSLAWTAWSEVGMAAEPALQALLASRGVRSLRPDQGAAAFRALLLSEVQGTVLITAQPLPTTIAAGWPLAAPSPSGKDFCFPVPLDPSAPALADHQVGRRPLVPAALWLAALVEAARTISGREGSWMVERFEILAPTFVDRPRSDVSLTLTQDGEAFDALVTAGGATVCRARVVPCEQPRDDAPPRPLVDAESAETLYRPDLLFHGPAWRVLTQTRTEDGRAEADLLINGRLPPGPGGPVAGAIDGIHQLLAAWSGRQQGWLGLPVGADRWIASGPIQGPLRVETQAVATGTRELQAEVVARDASGRVVLRGEGVRLRAATRSPSDA